MMIFDAFREHRPFPGQDPWVVCHDGALLLVQSADHDRQIVVKRFEDLGRMHRNEASVIWNPGRRGDHSRQIWAPELHRIDGRWYVYYTASDGRPENHRLYALGADDPLGPYEDLGKVADPVNDTWAIDMTVLEHDGGLYAVWSGWDGPNDGFPQNLYIAPMANPWTMSGERHLISTPEYGWETSVAPVNEGPQVLRNVEQDKLFIVYSADASWSTAYKMGLLEWVGGDLLNPASWVKLPRPIFTGGGHGCFIETAMGRHLVYHRKMSADPGWADREIRSEAYAWDSHGYPVIAGEAVGLSSALELAEAVPVRSLAGASAVPARRHLTPVAGPADTADAEAIAS